MSKPFFNLEGENTVNVTGADKQEELASEVNSALGNAAGGADKKSKEASEDEIAMSKISEDDTRLASELIFRGYAEMELEFAHIPDAKITICSSTSQEIDTVNDILFDVIKDITNDDGSVDMSNRVLTSLRNSLTLAVGFVGLNGDDISSDPITKLKSIKAGIKKLTEVTMSGDIEKAEKLKKSVYKAVKDRAAKIRELPTVVIDNVTDEKYKFDTRMFEILNIRNIIPK